MKMHSDFLFRLIQNLNPSEKRYFKLYASRHVLGGKNDYQKLFEVIERQTEYDEERVKKALRGESMLRHFSTAKTRLKEMILDALDDYERNNSSQEQVKKQLHQACLLASKGFKKEAISLLKKIQKRAMLSDALEVALMATKMKASVCGLENLNLKAQLKEEKYYSHLIQNQSVYNSLHYQIYQLLYQRNVHHSEEYKRALEVIFQHPLLKNVDQALTFRAKMQYYDLHILYYEEVKNDFELSYRYQKAQVQFFENHQERLKLTPAVYYTLVFNLLNTYSGLKKYQEIASGLKQLEKMAKQYGFYKSVQFRVSYFSSRMALLLGVFRATHQHEKGWELMPDLLEGLEEYASLLKLRTKLELYRNAIYYYFSHGNYSDVLTWTAKILEKKLDVKYRDSVSVARILQVVIHYEWGNANFVLGLIRNYQRHLKKQGKMFKTELIVFKYIKYLAKTIEKNHKVVLLQKLRLELETLEENPAENFILRFFPFQHWIEAQLTERTLKEVVLQRKVPQLATF